MILFGVDEYFSCINCYISKEWDGNAFYHSLIIEISWSQLDNCLLQIHSMTFCIVSGACFKMWGHWWPCIFAGIICEEISENSKQTHNPISFFPAFLKYQCFPLVHWYFDNAMSIVQSNCHLEKIHDTRLFSSIIHDLGENVEGWNFKLCQSWLWWWSWWLYDGNDED